MKSRDIIKIIDKKIKEKYSNPDSILKRYDEFLAINDIYRVYNPMTFRKNLKGHFELCDGIIELYHQAKIRLEKESLLRDLLAIGYDKDELVKMILEVFNTQDNKEDMWEYGDILYCMKKYKYMPQYLEIIKNKEYGTSRQMVVLLVGKSKKPEVIPVLKELLEDADVYGHALEALTNFEGEDIKAIMQQYSTHKMTWVRNTAKKYLKKREIK